MKSNEPLISSAFRSYDCGFMDPIVPQSKMYSFTDAGAAGRVCAIREAMAASVIAAHIKSESFFVRMRAIILHYV